MNQQATMPRPQDFDMERTTVALLNKSEIEQQIATARKYPRSVKTFLNKAIEMVTLSEGIAQECIYSLPRDGKVIEGPSARFAEIIVSAWGNSRAGARVVNEDGEFVTAQGVFHDLEHNTAITFEVQRRIVNRDGRRFSHDMIGVTANAACSIALRNAILKGVPKAFWSDLFLAARKTVMGDFKTLPNRRAAAFEQFVAFGIGKDQVCKILGVKGVEDIGLEHLVTLGGVLTALKEGDTTPEELLADKKPQVSGEHVTPMKSLDDFAAAAENGSSPTHPPQGEERADPETGELPAAASGEEPDLPADLRRTPDNKLPPKAAATPSGTDAKAWLAELDQMMAGAKNADDLAVIFEKRALPVKASTFPPDWDQAELIRKKHEVRLGL